MEYPIAQATQHPIMETFRVQSYRQALLSQDPEAATLLGELMFQVLSETPFAPSAVRLSFAGDSNIWCIVYYNTWCVAVIGNGDLLPSLSCTLYES